MRYQFLIDTYDTECLKVVSVCSMFRDEDLPVRPHSIDTRGRSVHEQMVHQCVSEDLWFRTMLGIQVSAPLPDSETRLQFIKQYASSSAERLDALRSQPRPPLLMTAAWGGLKPAPDNRLRRAFRHLPYSLLRRTMVEPDRVTDDLGGKRYPR